MHTYEDKTGIIFHYNSDLSGGITIVVPPNNPHGDGTQMSIEADVLSRFFCHAMFDAEEFLAWIDQVKEWLMRHSYAGIESEVPTLVRPQPQRCETCEDAPDDCYPDPPGSGGCDSHKPKRSGFKFAVGEKVFLTFSEANGETGVVTDVGFNTTGAGRYEYADVKLDKDGTQTGPLPVTCVHIRRPEDS